MGHLGDKGYKYDPNTPCLGLKVFMDAPRGADYGKNTVGADYGQNVGHYVLDPVHTIH